MAGCKSPLIESKLTNDSLAYQSQKFMSSSRLPLNIYFPITKCTSCCLHPGPIVCTSSMVCKLCISISISASSSVSSSSVYHQKVYLPIYMLIQIFGAESRRREGRTGIKVTLRGPSGPKKQENSGDIPNP